MYSCWCVNNIFNGLVEKMVDDLGSNFFSPNIITVESIEISMWKLNKAYDLGLNSFESFYYFHMKK